jgi:hypothetical protein
VRVLLEAVQQKDRRPVSGASPFEEVQPQAIRLDEGFPRLGDRTRLRR